MACSHGHIFCKVCIIENLMVQKKQHEIEFKKYEKEIEINKANMK
jgi:hypothetical protein